MEEEALHDFLITSRHVQMPSHLFLSGRDLSDISLLCFQTVGQGGQVQLLLPERDEHCVPQDGVWWLQGGN